MDYTKYFYSSISRSIETTAYQLVKNNGKNKGDSFLYTIFSSNEAYKNESVTFKITISDLEISKEDNAVYKKLKLDIKCVEPEYDEIFKVYFYDSIIDDDLISLDIRNSKTFKFNENNTYRTEYFIFVVSENGFHLCDKSAANSKDKYSDLTIERFDRFLNLYLLTLAYNIKMENFLEKGAELYTNNTQHINNIMDLRESIHAFDLQYFFENPVKMNRHETYKIWEMIFSKYKVKDKHDEVKMQVLSLTEILVKNKEKLLEEKENNIRKREDKFHKNIAILGIYLAIIPIFIEILDNFKPLSAYKLYILLIVLIITIIILLPVLFKKNE